MNEKPIDRVRYIIEDQALSVSAFEKKVGLSNNSIQQALKRGTNLKDETLINILKTFTKYSAEWLLTGYGQKFKDHGEVDNSSQKKKGHFTACGFIEDNVVKQLDRFNKKDILVYLEMNKSKFKEEPEFHILKNLLVKDDLIKELIEKLGEK